MNIIDYIRIVRNDKERKPSLKILREALHCAVLEKEIPIFYFTSHLYKKDAPNYKNYIGHKKIFNITKNYFYPTGRNNNLENKTVFHKIMSENTIQTPSIYAYNNKYIMITDGVHKTIENTAQLIELLRVFITSSKSASIFVKPIEGEGGKHSFKFGEESLYVNEKTKELYRLMGNVRFVFQETLTQHRDINKIYSKSINTIRIHTYKDKKTGEVEIISALMRFGFGGTVIDNGSSGGMFIPIDLSDWKLVGDAKSYLKSGGLTYSHHPDTKQIFDQTKLPFREEVNKVVIKAAKLFNNDFIGWDVSISEEEPIIIEGNDGPHLIMAQMACGGFKNHEKYKKIFKEYI